MLIHAKSHRTVLNCAIPTSYMVMNAIHVVPIPLEIGSHRRALCIPSSTIEVRHEQICLPEPDHSAGETGAPSAVAEAASAATNRRCRASSFAFLRSSRPTFSLTSSSSFPNPCSSFRARTRAACSCTASSAIPINNAIQALANRSQVVMISEIAGGKNSCLIVATWSSRKVLSN